MRHVVLFLKLILSIGLITYLLNSFDFAKLSPTFSTRNWILLLSAGLGIPLFIAIKTLKWHLIVRRAGAEEGFRISLYAILIGLGFGIFTPGRIGELLRVKYYSGVNPVVLGGLVVLDRFIDLIAVLFLGLYFVVERFGLLYAYALTIMNIVLLVAPAMLGRFLRRNDGIFDHWKFEAFPKLRAIVVACTQTITPQRLAIYCGVSLINWLLVTIQFHILINIYHPTTFLVALSSLPVIQLTNLFPVTIGGIGVREALSIFVLDRYNVPQEVAALSAFSLYAIDVLIPGIAGLVLFNLIRHK